ncbi:MAG: tungsten ABC transporter permease [Anaeromyxobacter sp. RBG_16_69_14]|nr:MAG: tungsten ABC transporter permease [Anaeromyxobacter sp. RBG_16_69_14]
MTHVSLACAVALAIPVSGVRVAQAADKIVLMSSTIGPIDSGIVDVLEDRFEKETGIRVRHVGAGTGQALKIAESGSVDVVMVHAKALEEEFVEKGFGTERIPFMYNDFVIVGPAGDPAGIRSAKTAVDALRAISAKGAPFVSRGDRSGTHVAEMELWEKAGLKPAGAWYEVYEKGSLGNAATLKYTDGKQGYTLIDRATWLSVNKDAPLKLSILVEKDPALLNFISLIPVNQRKFPGVNHRGAAAFVEWLTAPRKGQKVVQEFGKEKYGAALFFPNSRQWEAAHKK